MTIAQRLKQLRAPRLNIVRDPEGHRDSIHRLGRAESLMPLLVVSRGGAWTGGTQV